MVKVIFHVFEKVWDLKYTLSKVGIPYCLFVKKIRGDPFCVLNFANVKNVSVQKHIFSGVFDFLS